MGPAPIPPPSLPLQPPRTSTPLQSTMSPPTAAPPPSQIDLHGRSPVPISASALPNTIPSPATPAAKPAARAAPPLPPTPFRAPVSLYELVGEFPFTDLNSKVPWLSVPDSPFPARLPRRRRNSRLLQSSSISVELPVKETQRKDPIKPAEQAQPKTRKQTVAPPVEASSEPQTPTVSAAPSDADSTNPTTPSSAVPPPLRAQPPSKTTTKPPVPLVPVVPVVPPVVKVRRSSKDTASRASSDIPRANAAATNDVSPDNKQAPPAEKAIEPAADGAEEATNKLASLAPAVPPAPAPPKSWADLVRSKTAPRSTVSVVEPSRITLPKSESMPDVLASLGGDESVRYSDKIAFLEPRGLVNTGNMCYMNSVRLFRHTLERIEKLTCKQILQILVSCVPFFQFLDLVGRRAAHSFHSDAPMIDAM